MGRIKALLTDLDGTLYRDAGYEAEIKRLTLEIVAEKLGVDVEEAKRRLNEARRACVTLTLSLEHVGVPRELFYEELSRRLRYAELLKPDPKIAELLYEVRRRGYRLKTPFKRRVTTALFKLCLLYTSPSPRDRG